MGKKLIYVWQVEISAATKLTVLTAKTCAAGTTNNIESSMLVLDFMMKCRLKILNGISVESM